MRTFGLSIGVTVLCLSAALVWGGWIGLYLVAVLAVLEVSLSFDNAVVNASVLKQMDRSWQQINIEDAAPLARAPLCNALRRGQ